MDERTISVKQLDDLTECPICTENFTDPRSLPCVHTFCLKCIAQWSSDKLSARSVNCPICRREFTIPKDGIEGLPKNIFIAKLLAMKHEPETAPVGRKLCDPCRADSTVLGKKEVAAKLFCVDCQESLCELCSELHSKMKLTRAHRTETLGDPIDTPTTPLPTVCDKHPTKELELYCLDCHETLCTVCFVTQHNGHKSAEIAKVAAEFRHDMRLNISHLQITVIHALSNTLKNFQEKRQNAAEKFSKVEKEVCARADELKATIERHKQLLLTELNERRIGTLGEIDKKIIKASQDKTLLESFVKYSEELLQKGSDGDIARESRNVTLQSTELKRVCGKDNDISLQGSAVIFKPSTMMFESHSNVIGSLTTNVRDGENMATPGSPSMPPQFERGNSRQRPSFKTASERNVTSHKPESKSCPTLTFSAEGKEGVYAVCALKDQIYTTRCEANYVEVYDVITFQRLKNITVRYASNNLYGIAACSANNCLYVAVNGDDEVHRVKLSDLQSSVRWSVGNSPFGLSVNRSHNVLVACSGDKKIQEYHTMGLLIREIKDIHSLGHAVQLSERTIVMTQIESAHRIAVKSVDGRFIKCYGSKTSGSGPGKMNNPGGLAVDSKGFILVADNGNNRILVVNPDLTEGRPLPLPPGVKLTGPETLFYDESRGRLYVGEGDEKRRLLVFDNVNLNSLFSQ